MERIIFHADIDYCYAQIELREHPEWRGRPLAVGGSREDRHGIILAKCPAAKKAGVKTGMALWQAIRFDWRNLIMRRYYGFQLNPDGVAEAHPTESTAVKLIFTEYLKGLSLGRISESLQQHGYPSPADGQTWNRSSIDNILKKGYYIGTIVTFEDFAAAQFERQARSNTNEDTGKRKTTRYHSKNELSGLLVCAECGEPYRRITRHSGEVVWRCRNRVEYGGQVCKLSPPVSEETALNFLLVNGLDAVQMCCDGISLKVCTDGQLTVVSPELEMTMISEFRLW